MTPKSFTFDRLPEITVADCVTDFCIFFVFRVGGEIVWCDTSFRLSNGHPLGVSHQYGFLCANDCNYLSMLEYKIPSSS